MSTSSPEILSTRQEKLSAALQSAGLDALALNPGPTLTYLTGLHFHLSERPVVAVFTPGAPITLVLPELEAAKARDLPYPLQAFPYPENPALWEEVFRQALEGREGGKIGVVPRRLRLLELRLLEAAAPTAQLLPAEDTVAALRMRKDAAEIAAMRQAAEIAQRALQAALKGVEIGISERELANELTIQLLRHGSNPQMPFSPIVASGPYNSANPHAFPTGRQLQPGDMLVIDWGAAVDGYVSDITRTFAIGEVDEEMARIAQITLEANTAARNIAAPGVTAGAVDKAARDIIEAAGYGQYFTHRTGHGLGLEGHEDPYIRGDSGLILEPGMTFTIEPGIYIPGKGGVRIEDDVIITEDGLESFTDLPRELVRIL